MDRFVQVACLDEDEAAELLLRLDEGTIGRGDLSVPDAQARGRVGGLQGVGGEEMAAAPEVLIVRERLDVERFVLAPAHGLERRLVDPDRAQVLHVILLIVIRVDCGCQMVVGSARFRHRVWSWPAVDPCGRRT